MPFNIGENVGPYRLVEQLGQGGMASVYKAYHAALDRFVAIKVLHIAFLEDPDFQARFQREARVVARLEHPNIVPIYDFAEHERRPYLVMKFIEGETLKACLQRGQLSLAEIARVVEPVGSALAYAHQQNVLHRDVKPSNVLMAQDGQIYLADFGLARMAQSGDSSLTADRMVGTPQYISPEQAQSLPNLDARTDIYSFGVMVYEMVVGRVPFSADTPFAIIHDQIYAPLPMPRQVNPDVPESIERVLLKALAKDPADRFEDMSAFMKALLFAIQEVTSKEKTAINSGDASITLAVEEPPPPAEALPATVVSEKPASLNATPGTTVIPAPAQPVKKSQNGWKIAGVIAGILILLLLCTIVALPALRKAGANRQAKQLTLQAPSTALLVNPATAAPLANQPSLTPAVTIFATPDLGQAQDLLKSALTKWSNGNIQGATKDLTTAEAQIGTDKQAFAQAAYYLESQNAWLLAAIFISKQAQNAPADLTAIQVNRLHEIFYKAAKDPLGGTFFSQAAGFQLLMVAEIRYQLYNGNTAQANTDLQRVLQNPIQLRRFPEARLLQAESALLSNDKPTAINDLNQLIPDNTLPAWVKAAAQELKQGIKS